MKKIYIKSCIILLNHPLLSFLSYIIIINIFYLLFFNETIYCANNDDKPYEPKLLDAVQLTKEVILHEYDLQFGKPAKFIYPCYTESPAYNIDNHHLPGDDKTMVTNDWKKGYNILEEKKRLVYAQNKAMYNVIENGFGIPSKKVPNFSETPSLFNAISNRNVDMTSLHDRMRVLILMIDKEGFFIEKDEILEIDDFRIQRILEIYRDNFNNFVQIPFLPLEEQFQDIVSKTDSITMKYCYVCFRTLFNARITALELRMPSYDNNPDYINDYVNARRMIIRS